MVSGVATSFMIIGRLAGISLLLHITAHGIRSTSFRGRTTCAGLELRTKARLGLLPLGKQGNARAERLCKLAQEI